MSNELSRNTQDIIVESFSDNLTLLQLQTIGKFTKKHIVHTPSKNTYLPCFYNTFSAYECSYSDMKGDYGLEIRTFKWLEDVTDVFVDLTEDIITELTDLKQCNFCLLCKKGFNGEISEHLRMFHNKELIEFFKELLIVQTKFIINIDDKEVKTDKILDLTEDIISWLGFEEEYEHYLPNAIITIFPLNLSFIVKEKMHQDAIESEIQRNKVIEKMNTLKTPYLTISVPYAKFSPLDFEDFFEPNLLNDKYKWEGSFDSIGLPSEFNFPNEFKEEVEGRFAFRNNLSLNIKKTY